MSNGARRSEAIAVLAFLLSCNSAPAPAVPDMQATAAEVDVLVDDTRQVTEEWNRRIDEMRQRLDGGAR